jgi:hypothetical protein
MYSQYDVDESNWAHAERQNVRRLNGREELSESAPKLWKEPFIVQAHVLKGSEFVYGPSDMDIAEYLLEELGECKITFGEEQCERSFQAWFHEFRLKPEMYLRDMHVNRVKKCFRLFTTPNEFPDWLTEYCTKNVPSGDRPVLDFQFLYWGAKGSKTPFHMDVMGTFSWSHNLRGTKRWNFFMDSNLILECTQEPGETVFVPSQCFHTVVNLCDDTISINQNWINEFNIDKVAEQLVADSNKVRSDLVEYGWEDSDDALSNQVEALVWANNSLNIENLLKVIDFSTNTRGEGSFSDAARHNILKALDQIDRVFHNNTMTSRIRNRLA